MVVVERGMTGVFYYFQVGVGGSWKYEVRFRRDASLGLDNVYCTCIHGHHFSENVQHEF